MEQWSMKFAIAARVDGRTEYFFGDVDVVVHDDETPPRVSVTVYDRAKMVLEPPPAFSRRSFNVLTARVRKCMQRTAPGRYWTAVESELERRLLPYDDDPAQART